MALSQAVLCAILFPALLLTIAPPGLPRRTRATCCMGILVRFVENGDPGAGVPTQMGVFARA
jgi:hypothetical protein